MNAPFELKVNFTDITLYAEVFDLLRMFSSGEDLQLIANSYLNMHVTDQFDRIRSKRGGNVTLNVLVGDVRPSNLHADIAFVPRNNLFLLVTEMKKRYER